MWQRKVYGDYKNLEWFKHEDIDQKSYEDAI